MCGIAGYRGRSNVIPLQRMLSLLTHRGPDESGYYEDDLIGLANARLRIIDLEGGHQPLCGEDSRIWVTFNGEIFNYKEERAVLQHLGHRFGSNSDTEVLVHLYEQYGIDFVRKLNGMFAFALWDSARRTLYLARDYAGMKPLYFCHVNEDTVYFASEIKSLLPCQERVGLNPTALCDFLTFGYLPTTETIFKGIRKLRPGQVLSIDETGTKAWDYNRFELKVDPATSGPGYESALVAQLRQAAEDWLMSDVPVGAYISGGLDSSLIAALAVRRLGESVKTYTAWFGPEHPHELREASVVATYLSSDHTNVLVSEDEVVSNLERIAWFYDEPIADAAVVPTYFVSRAASRDVKVVVAGEGADELFAGYYQQRLLNYAGKLYGDGRDDIQRRNRYPNSYIGAKIAGLALPGFSLPERYIALTSVFPPRQARRLAPGAQSTETFQVISTFLTATNGSTLGRILLCDAMTRMAESYLMKADKGSMANSIEERSPYLDKSLMRLAFTLPDHLKVTLGTDKVILRRAARDMVPRSTIKRRKRGYGVPVRGWIRGQIGAFLENMIEESDLASGSLDQGIVRKVVGARLRRPFQFWMLGSLALWDHVYGMKVKNMEVPAG